MTIAKNTVWKLKMIIQTDVRKNFLSFGVIWACGRRMLTINSNFTRTFFKVSNLARLVLDFKEKFHAVAGPPGLLGVLGTFFRDIAQF